MRVRVVRGEAQRAVEIRLRLRMALEARQEGAPRHQWLSPVGAEPHRLAQVAIGFVLGAVPFVEPRHLDPPGQVTRLEFQEFPEEFLGFSPPAPARRLAGQAQEALGGSLGRFGVGVHPGGLRNFRGERSQRKAVVRCPGRRVALKGVGGEEVSQGLLATAGSAVSRTAHGGRGEGEPSSSRG